MMDPGFVRFLEEYYRNGDQLQERNLKLVGRLQGHKCFLHNIIKENQVELLQELLENYSETSTRMVEKEKQPLAQVAPWLRLAEPTLPMGCYKITAFHRAVYDGRADCLRILLDYATRHDIDVTALRNKEEKLWQQENGLEGMNLLEMALERQNFECYNLLAPYFGLGFHESGERKDQNPRDFSNLMLPRLELLIRPQKEPEVQHLQPHKGALAGSTKAEEDEGPEQGDDKDVDQAVVVRTWEDFGAAIADFLHRPRHETESESGFVSGQPTGPGASSTSSTTQEHNVNYNWSSASFITADDVKIKNEDRGFKYLAGLSVHNVFMEETPTDEQASAFWSSILSAAEHIYEKNDIHLNTITFRACRNRMPARTLKTLMQALTRFPVKRPLRACAFNVSGWCLPLVQIPAFSGFTRLTSSASGASTSEDSDFARKTGEHYRESTCKLCSEVTTRTTSNSSRVLSSTSAGTSPEDASVTSSAETSPDLSIDTVATLGQGHLQDELLSLDLQVSSSAPGSPLASATDDYVDMAVVVTMVDEIYAQAFARQNENFIQLHRTHWMLFNKILKKQRMPLDSQSSIKAKLVALSSATLAETTLLKMMRRRTHKHLETIQKSEEDQERDAFGTSLLLVAAPLSVANVFWDVARLLHEEPADAGNNLEAEAVIYFGYCILLWFRHWYAAASPINHKDERQEVNMNSWETFCSVTLRTLGYSVEDEIESGRLSEDDYDELCGDFRGLLDLAVETFLRMDVALQHSFSRVDRSLLPRKCVLLGKNIDASPSSDVVEPDAKNVEGQQAEVEVVATPKNFYEYCCEDLFAEDLLRELPRTRRALEKIRCFYVA
ncbi:unnamed protein product [Amoebophrya sp. A25]|nr:unnamed protein product [Amoebophrya sp. A25]|eukprot:GSA25T00014939001.1